MITLLEKVVKTNLAQFTNIFDLVSQPSILQVQSNIIQGPQDLDSEWTVRGSELTMANEACVNSTFEFIEGRAEAVCYFGDELVDVNVELAKLNVGSAVNRDMAVKLAGEDKPNNRVIIYANAVTNDRKASKLGQDLNIVLEYQIGIMYMIDAEQMKALGCTSLDNTLIPIPLGVHGECTSILNFQKVGERQFVGKFYVVEYLYSYTKTLEINDIILNRVKSFDQEDLQLKL